MEGSTEPQPARHLGRDLIGGATFDQHGTQVNLESAKIHRELAVGNFFVRLRELVSLGTKFLNAVMEQELADQQRRAEGLRRQR